MKFHDCMKPVSASVLLLLAAGFLVTTANLEAKRGGNATADTTHFYEDIRTKLSDASSKTTPETHLARQ